MRHTNEAIDPDGMIRPLESYAMASLLGCGALCIAAVILVVLVAAIVRWL